MKITKKDVKSAIRRFKNGERPFKYTGSRTWFVVGEDESLYPLKYIYSLIVNAEPKSFNTSEPISVFTKLDVELLHIPKSASDDFYKRVQESLKNKHARKARLKKANATPAQKTSKIVIYDRNPDVVAEVLERANGKCEECGSDAPFKRKKDGSPYLEVHHIIQLSDGGLDTVENAEALCPNCHRRKHYG